MALLDGSGKAADQPLSESPHSTVGYDSVAETLRALRSRDGVVFRTENGWLIATDEEAYTVWSFAPEDYPAYPAVVERKVIPQGRVSAIQMNVHCEASKEAYDDLVREFAKITGLPLEEQDPHQGQATAVS